MLTATQKDNIINSRGESAQSTERCRSYSVILKETRFPMISMTNKSYDQLVIDCAGRFGDSFVRLDKNA